MEIIEKINDYLNEKSTVTKPPKNIAGWVLADGNWKEDSWLEYEKKYKPGWTGHLSTGDVDEFFDGDATEMQVTLTDSSGLSKKAFEFKKYFTIKNGINGIDAFVKKHDRLLKAMVDKSS